MGMGHVPPGEVSRAREGVDLPRRERRGTGEVGALAVDDSRRILGRAGEAIAAWYLTEAGLQVVGRNIGVGRGEVDIVAIDGGDRVAVEVRTISGPADPIDAVDAAKRKQVARLGRQIGANRIDFIGIRVGDSAMDIHWLPGRK